MQRPARDKGRLFGALNPSPVLVATDLPPMTGGIHDVFMATVMVGLGRLDCVW
jgi:hypothetical protein